MLSLAEIPSELIASFSKPPITGPFAFSQMVEKRKQHHRQRVMTYGMMASEARGWKEYADNQEKMIKEFRFESNLDYEWVCVRSPRTANWPDPGSAHKKRLSFLLDNRGEPVASSDLVSLACWCEWTW